MLVYNGKDAVADSNQDQTDGIDFDSEGYGTVFLEILDILTKDTVVYQPIVKIVRGANPERCSKQQKWRCRQQWQEDSGNCKGKRDRA